jgi:hypothetical protein
MAVDNEIARVQKTAMETLRRHRTYTLQCDSIAPETPSPLPAVSLPRRIAKTRDTARAQQQANTGSHKYKSRLTNMTDYDK